MIIKYCKKRQQQDSNLRGYDIPNRLAICLLNLSDILTFILICLLLSNYQIQILNIVCKAT